MLIRNLPCLAKLPYALIAAALISPAAFTSSALAAQDKSHAGMKAIDLDGLRVWLGQPQEVTKQIGWSSGETHGEDVRSWSFIHMTPYMARFPQGNLVVTYTMDPDTQTNPICLSAFQISSDGGTHWGRRYSAINQHNPLIFLPKEDDSLLGVACEFTRLSAAEPTTFTGPAYWFKHGGDGVLLMPDAVKIVGWPWAVETHPSVQPEASWHVSLCMTGSAVQSGKKLLATGHYFERSSDSRHLRLFHNVLLVSEDGGFTWRYRSTVADYDPAMVGRPHYEGPNESFMIRLADGDLMNVFRIGTGTGWYLHRSYSHDEGLTWSREDVLPAWSVRPSVLRLTNGCIALSTGRPGIYLWVASDPRATHWQSVDLMAHHNAWAPDADMRIGPFQRLDQSDFQTSSYTSLMEMSPNHLLMVYDRGPEQRPSGPRDLTRVYVLPIEIERK